MSLTAPTSDEIKAFRNTLQLSQAAFAEKVGVSTRAVEDWEAGKRPPPEMLRPAMVAIKAGDPLSLEIAEAERQLFIARERAKLLPYEVTFDLTHDGAFLVRGYRSDGNFSTGFATGGAIGEFIASPKAQIERAFSRLEGMLRRPGDEA